MTKYEMAITLLQDAHERMIDPVILRSLHDECMACGAVLPNGWVGANPDQIVDRTTHAKECLIVEIDKFLERIS